MADSTNNVAAVRHIGWYVVFGALAAVVVCIALSAFWLWPQFIYARERKATYDIVAQLPHRRPADVNAAAWEEASTWAITAYANVCFSEDHVPIDELRRFRIDVEERLKGDVDLATIDWIWQRLGETGPHGQKYRQRFEPQYRENLNVALATGRRV